MLVKSISKILAIIIALTMAATVFPAMDSYGAEKTPIKISKTKLTLYVGTSQTLKMSGTNKKVKWSTTSKRIASVTSKGKVSAKKTGSATIKAKVGKKTYKCKVTVKKAPKLNKSKATIYANKSTTLKIKGYKIGTAKWSSSKKSVAKVSSTGKVTGVNKGTAYIYAKIGKKTLKCKVTVKVRAIQKLSLNKTKVEVKQGREYKLKPVVKPTNGSLVNTKWWSGNEKIVKVNQSGVVTGVAPGSAYVYFKAGGKKASAKVTVKEITYGNITYVLNKGVNVETNPDVYEEGEELVLAEPTRENHVFKGWFTDKACTQPISKISSDMRGDVTLYAKWHLKALNITGEGMDDMIWSWWYYPQVISEGDDVYWGYATKEGYCGVARYDGETGKTVKTTLKKAAADDHNGLALTLLDDKRIMCVYAGGHNTDNEIHIRISDNPMDISTFSTDIVLESAGKTCYGQIVRSDGKYYLFYRVNNHSWAYRSSVDGTSWSDEVIAIKTSMQYYCKVVNTTDDDILRILMYSNPAAAAPEIRMGFLDTTDDSIYAANGTTKLASNRNNYDVFEVLQIPEEGKTQRLFDAAVTEPENPRFLYASFTNKTKTNDSVYYLYDAGKSYKICDGGKPLWDPKYQLGASFVDKDTIVAGRSDSGTDYIEMYKFDGTNIELYKTLDNQIGIGWARNARPIADVKQRAILWHNGYYDLKSYSNFDTDARLYLLEKDSLIADKQGYLDAADLARVKPENVEAVQEYAAKLYEENTMEDYTKSGFTWDPDNRNTGWIYFSGLMMEAFLHTDFEQYDSEVYEYYRQHVITDEDGNIKIKGYAVGELDAAMPAVGMLTLINSGTLGDEDEADFKKAANYVYNQLERQTIYPQAGNLWLHSQQADGTPRKHWARWNICLDGVYMSQLFLIRLAETIDAGEIEIMSIDGSMVTSEQLWDDIYSRMTFVMDNMKNPDNGLLYHGYSVEEKTTNKASWSRGIGWFAMALMEAAEKMPDAEKRAVLTTHYEQQMKALLQWQDPETFLWYNVTDGREEYVYHKTTENGTEAIYNMPETSGSAMFAYCLLRGYHNGVLKDDEFRTAGLRAFNALAETKLTEKGLEDIYDSSSVTGDKNMYQINGYVVDDGKGAGPFILASKYAY